MAADFLLLLLGLFSYYIKQPMTKNELARPQTISEKHFQQPTLSAPLPETNTTVLSVLVSQSKRIGHNYQRVVTSTNYNRVGIINALQHFLDYIAKYNSEVHFRRCTREQAMRLGLRGWCMNTDSGSVKGLLEGQHDGLMEMKYWLRNTGSPASHVSRVNFSEMQLIAAFTCPSFDIKH